VLAGILAGVGAAFFAQAHTTLQHSSDGRRISVNLDH